MKRLRVELQWNTRDAYVGAYTCVRYRRRHVYIHLVPWVRIDVSWSASAQPVAPPAIFDDGGDADRR